MHTLRTVVTRDHIDVDDLRMSADELDDKYNPAGGGEHPIFTRAHWRSDVAHQITVAGYWEWVRQTMKDASIEPVTLTGAH